MGLVQLIQHSLRLYIDLDVLSGPNEPRITLGVLAQTGSLLNKGS